MRTLFIIPARGGSKSVPGKNIKKLGGRPLIWYTLDVAAALADKEDICVSTDSMEIAGYVEKYGIPVRFKRPAELSGDDTGQFDVVRHAADFCFMEGGEYDRIVLLQVTSPFRSISMIRQIIDAYDTTVDMIIGVCRADANPYFNLYKESPDGYLEKFMEGSFTGRQQCPDVWQVNGSVYVINPQSLKKYSSFAEFRKIRGFEMPEELSIDIDTPTDWDFAEFMAAKRKIVAD